MGGVPVTVTLGVPDRVGLEEEEEEGEGKALGLGTPVAVPTSPKPLPPIEALLVGLSEPPTEGE